MPERCCVPALMLVACLAIVPQVLGQVEPKPRSPADSLKQIEVIPGFKVELVAAEPMVIDPVAFAWGPDGRLWVAEMSDYPGTIDGKHEPGTPHGRVVYLVDSDNDGKYDKRHVFLEGLHMPNGVLAWRDGVLITSAPNIIYAEDTGWDGVADKIETLYTGFGEKNPQLLVNGLTYGLDGWVYGANGLSGGKVKSTKTGKVVDISGRDFRINPDTGDIEAIEGASQFGRCRDDFGNWFGCNNSELIYHYVLPERYTRRNPDVTYPDPRVQLVTPRNPPVYPISQPLERIHAPYMANRFTSICSTTIYRDTLLGEAFYGNAFACEPVHNVVTRRILKRKGVTFTAERAKGEEQREFLASRDHFFRPVFLRTGPDGALWIADMYRREVEHPKWVPQREDAQERLKAINLREGDDKGRIWRVVPEDGGWREADGVYGMPNLTEAKPEVLVETLGNPSGTVRDLTQSVLAWSHSPTDDQRKAVLGRYADVEILNVGSPAHEQAMKRLQVALDRITVLKPLERYAEAAVNPAATVHALWTLRSMSLLRSTSVMSAIRDKEPLIRQQGLRLAEDFLGPRMLFTKTPHANQQPLFLDRRDPWEGDFVDSIIECSDAPDAMVRMQFALAIGQASDRFGSEALGRILIRDAHDSYMTAAALSSVKGREEKIAEAVFRSANVGDVSPDQLRQLVRLAVARGGNDAVLSLIVATWPNASALTDWQRVVIAAILDEIENRKVTLADLADIGSTREVAAVGVLQDLLGYARDEVVDATLSPAHRVFAVSLLARDAKWMGRDAATLAGLLVPAVPRNVQQAAIQRLAKMATSDTPGLLLDQWVTHGPALRTQITDILLRRETWTAKLLDHITIGVVKPIDLSAADRQRLLTHKSAAIRDRAKELLGDTGSAARRAVVEQYKDVAALSGQAADGAKIFQKTCAACHRMAGVGDGAAPDLASLTDRSPDTLLVSILDPNRAVEPKYAGYIAENADGEAFVGMIVGETGGSVTMVGADGTRRTFLRSDLVTLRATGLSFMPDGLEKGLSRQDLADVIAFIRERALPPRQLPGVKASVIRQSSDGSLYLWSWQSEVFGQAITFEIEDRNVGNWTHAGDYVAWRVDLPRHGQYEVWLDYACDDDAAGNAFVIHAEPGVADAATPTTIKAKTIGTGTWNDYRQRKVGTLTLSAGRQRVTFRSDGAIEGRLVDLRGLRLTRVGQ